MSVPARAVVFLPGAGGELPDLNLFRLGEGAAAVQAVAYPGWQRYVTEGFTPADLIRDLAAQIEAKVPCDRIVIVGMSIGGHFGYAVAGQLEATGRKIAGFCALDSAMTIASQPSKGWRGRAIARGIQLIRGRRLHDLSVFARAKFWRALIRCAGTRLPELLRRLEPSRLFRRVATVDPIFQGELDMRMLLQHTASWVGSLDRRPPALRAPAALLRTRGAAADDAAWRRRCPQIEIIEIPGSHESLFDAEHAGSLGSAFRTASRAWT